MKTVKQLLQEADPLQHEPKVADAERDTRLRALIAAASVGKRDPARPRFWPARLAVAILVAFSILFFGSRFWPQNTFESHAAVRFEARLAEDHAETGLREANIQGSDRSVYLHEEVIVSNGDIASAEVIPGNTPEEFWVSLQFNESGAQKMRVATEGHLGKRMAFLVDDQVVIAPVVKSSISAAAVINGRYTKEQAERIVNGIY
jgi:hypothetical protein